MAKHCSAGQPDKDDPDELVGSSKNGFFEEKSVPDPRSIASASYPLAMRFA
jgi:hypothetical protein